MNSWMILVAWPVVLAVSAKDEVLLILLIVA